MSNSESKAVSLFGSKETMPAHVKQDGRGSENVTQDDVAMPYLTVLQALSPQVDEIEGAKAGMLYNSITDDLYTEVYVVNLSFKREYSIFKKRDLGGGYEGAHASHEAALTHIKDVVGGDPADYDISENHRHVCLMLDSETGQPLQPVILNLSGTKVRVSRTWNSDINVKHNGADRFASIWKLTTRKQSNSKGSWYNLNIDFEGWADKDLYDLAAKYYEQVSAPETEAA